MQRTGKLLKVFSLSLMILIIAQMTGIYTVNASLVEEQYATRDQAYESAKLHYLSCVNNGIEPTPIQESSNMYFSFSCGDINYRIHFQYNSLIEEEEGNVEFLGNVDGFYWYIVGEVHLALLTAISLISSPGGPTDLCDALISDPVAKHFLC